MYSNFKFYLIIQIDLSDRVARINSDPIHHFAQIGQSNLDISPYFVNMTRTRD